MKTRTGIQPDKYPNLTVGKATADANGNVIDTTYAKLSQVVRVDAAQSLTDSEKRIAASNIARTGKATLSSPAWYKIAEATNLLRAVIVVKLVTDWGTDRPFSSIAIINNAGNQYGECIISTIGNYGHPVGDQKNIFTKIRLNGSRIEVYYNTTKSHSCSFEISVFERSGNDYNIFNFETTSQDEVSGSCFVCDFVNGTNTSGKVYQQGSPVLVGDQSAIFESDGTTVKEAKKIKDLTAEQMSELINFVQNLTPFYFTETDTAAKVTGLSDYGKSLTVLAIPSEYHGKPVTSIYDNAFLSDTNITSITIPSTVTSIGKNAFSACASLTGVTIPDSVTSIGNNAFSACVSLTSITIPDSVTSIEDGVFGNCRGLTSITIPDSVTSIGYRAFGVCSGLTSIIYNGTKAQWQRISKDATWDNLTGNYTVHCTDGNISKS